MVRDRVCLVFSPGPWGDHLNASSTRTGDLPVRRLSRFDQQPGVQQVVFNFEFHPPSGRAACQKTYHRAEGVTWLNRVKDCSK